MWVFLGSEMLLFAGLFALYAAYRDDVPRRVRARRSHHNALVLGTINTVVLIVLELHRRVVDPRAPRGRRAHDARGCSLLTMLLGVAFLVLKGIEYARALRARASCPGAYYAFAELPGARRAAVLHALLLHDRAARAPRDRRAVGDRRGSPPRGRSAATDARLSHRARARRACTGTSSTSSGSSSGRCSTWRPDDGRTRRHLRTRARLGREVRGRAARPAGPHRAQLRASLRGDRARRARSSRSRSPRSRS